jgi:hypothetical protein
MRFNVFSIFPKAAAKEQKRIQLNGGLISHFQLFLLEMNGTPKHFSFFKMSKP